MKCCPYGHSINSSLYSYHIENFVVEILSTSVNSQASIPTIKLKSGLITKDDASPLQDANLLICSNPLYSLVAMAGSQQGLHPWSPGVQSKFQDSGILLRAGNPETEGLLPLPPEDSHSLSPVFFCKILEISGHFWLMS
jgi:hypothetical protein